MHTTLVSIKCRVGCTPEFAHTYRQRRLPSVTFHLFNVLWPTNRKSVAHAKASPNTHRRHSSGSQQLSHGTHSSVSWLSGSKIPTGSVDIGLRAKSLRDLSGEKPRQTRTRGKKRVVVNQSQVEHGAFRFSPGLKLVTRHAKPEPRTTQDKTLGICQTHRTCMLLGPKCSKHAAN